MTNSLHNDDDNLNDDGHTNEHSKNQEDGLVHLSFYLTPEHECPYLENKQAKTAFLSPEIQTNNKLYSALITQGLRRSGEHIYKPHCDDCAACISVRIPVEKFRFSRSQKRALKKSAHFKQSNSPVKFNHAHYALFERYINQRHQDGDMYPPSVNQYQSFLLNESIESEYLNLTDPLTSQLICCSVIDKVNDGLSAVYTFFDPDYDNYSLGTVAILKLIQQCKNQNLDYLYLGYWIKDCQKMAYKSNFRPLQCFINNQWLELS